MLRRAAGAFLTSPWFGGCCSKPAKMKPACRDALNGTRRDVPVARRGHRCRHERHVAQGGATRCRSCRCSRTGGAKRTSRGGIGRARHNYHGSPTTVFSYTTRRDDFVAFDVQHWRSIQSRGGVLTRNRAVDRGWGKRHTAPHASRRSCGPTMGGTTSTSIWRSTGLFALPVLCCSCHSPEPGKAQCVSRASTTHTIHADSSKCRALRYGNTGAGRDPSRRHLYQVERIALMLLRAFL
jgi:hypothetical protein